MQVWLPAYLPAGSVSRLSHPGVPPGHLLSAPSHTFLSTVALPTSCSYGRLGAPRQPAHCPGFSHTSRTVPHAACPAGTLQAGPLEGRDLLLSTSVTNFCLVSNNVGDEKGLIIGTDFQIHQKDRFRHLSGDNCESVERTENFLAERAGFGFSRAT